MLALIFTMSYGQGLLAEGATKLLKSLFTTDAEPTTIVINADFRIDEEINGDSFKLNEILNSFNIDEEVFDVCCETTEFSPLVIKSFTIQSVNVVYENELETENWMTESFVNEIDEVSNVEDWMTESFSTDLETDIITEDWMTELLEESYESDVTSEEWMTTSFYDEIEAPVELENWMTLPLSEIIEEVPVETEDWMFETFTFASTESEIKVENWMTTPFYTSSEELLAVEEWMTQPIKL
jgi:hypothetical protein